jgi:tRNA A-37 threonylcarbamoyl transferase component Bud32
MSEPEGEVVAATATPDPDALARDVFFIACKQDEEFKRDFDLDTWQPRGDGSSAVVVRVFSKRRRKHVCLKLVSRGNEETEAKFASESQIGELVVSPHVVRIYGPRMTGNLLFLEMEDVEGVTLEAEAARKRAAGGWFGLGEAVELGQAIVDGVAAIHAAGVVHRDLKPANIILPAAGKPKAKIADFGISRFVDQGRATSTTEWHGTPRYAPPEFFRRVVPGEPRPPLGPASDVYSLGMVLYETFTGTNPYGLSPNATPDQWSIAHLNTPPVAPRLLNSALPQEVADILLDMLAKKPEQRPRLDEVARVLRTYADPAPAAASPGGPQRTRQRMVAVAGVGVGLVLVMMGLVATWSPEPGRSAAAPSVQPSLASTAPPSTVRPGAAPAAQGGPAERATQAFAVSVEDDVVTVTNQSGGLARDVEVILVSADGREHRASWDGELVDAEGQLFLPFGFFRPPVLEGTRIARVILTVKGTRLGPQSVSIPLP